MNTQLVPLQTPDHPDLIWTELQPRLWDEILAPGRRVGRDLPVVGASEMPTTMGFWKAADNSWVFASDYRTDPTFNATPGKVVMPRPEMEAFHSLADAGLNCDVIWVAHELPATWQPGMDVPQVPDPPKARNRRQVLERIQSSSTRLVRSGLQVGSAVLAAPLIIGLDPVVLGGLIHPATGAVVWAELARWDWE